MTQEIKMEFTWALDKDKTKVLIEIRNERDGEITTARTILDAHDLDNVIQNLAQARSQITPAFSRNLDPRPRFRNVVRGGAFHVSAGATPPESRATQVSMAALHPGFGWIAFALNANEAMELAASLATKANEVGQQARLVGPDGKPLA